MADLSAVMAATTLAYATYQLLQMRRQLHYPASTVLLAAFGFAVFFVLMLNHEGAYKQANSLLRIRETERILRVTIQAFATVFLVSFFFRILFLAGSSCWLLSWFRW